MVSRRVSARSTLFSSSLADRPPVYTASRPCSSAPAACCCRNRGHAVPASQGVPARWLKLNTSAGPLDALSMQPVYPYST
jgi:hypothetical protein